MRALVAVLSAILLYVPTADSASAGSLTVTDVKELAGTWQGYGRGYFGSGRLPLTWTVAEDGTYSSVGASVTRWEDRARKRKTEL